MSGSPERRTLDDILQNADSPTRESHFMTPTRRLLSTPTSFRIPTDPRRVSFSGDPTLRLFADETNMSQISEPSNLFESFLAEDYVLSPMRSTGDEYHSSMRITNVQRTTQTISTVEKENEQGYNHINNINHNKYHDDIDDDGHSAQEEEEDEEEEEEDDDDDMRITEQVETDVSTFHQYKSPHRTPLDDITDTIQTSPLPPPPLPLPPLENVAENVVNATSEMTMSEFLKLLCINTELPEIEPPRRRSIPFTSSTPSQEVTTQLYTLPMLAAIKEKTKELDQWIVEAAIQSDNWDKQVEQKNPELISNYINASYSDRSPYREMMGRAKEWEETNAEIECMKDHAAFLEARQKYFWSIERELEEKTRLTGKLKDEAVTTLEEKKRLHTKLKKQYNQALIAESESNKVDRKRTEDLITELKELKTVNENYAKEINEKQEKEVVLDQDIEDLNKEKTRLLKEIDHYNSTMKMSAPDTRQELSRIHGYYKLLTSRVGLELISHENNIFKVSIYDELMVSIDEIKLQAQDPDAVDITVKPMEEEALSQWSKGLRPLIANKWQISNVLQPLLIYWNRVRMLRRELELIQRRFITKVKPISHDDPNKCGVTWDIALLDFESKTKINIALEICVNEILRHPKIHNSKVKAVMEESSRMTQEQLDAMVYGIVEAKGLANISNSVADILKKASAPQ